MTRWRPLWPVAVLAVLLFTVLNSIPSARSQSPLPPIDATDLGLDFINSAEEPRSDARIRRGLEAGAVMDRFPLYWDVVERREGQFDWTKQDTALRANERNGLGTLALLMGTPGQYYSAAETPPPPGESEPIGGGPAHAISWASCSGGMPPPRGLDAPIFTNGSDLPTAGAAVNPANPWARYVGEAVNRYRPGGSAGLTVRHWEIWNEPDICQFWSGSAQQYARLLKVAYIVIKQADPSATVMWGGLAHFENEQFLYQMVDTIKADPLAARYNGFFDAAASHQYSNVTLGLTYTQRIRAALIGTGWEDKAVWITESGVPVCGSFPGPDCPSPYRANPEEQAAYIWQNIAYTRLAGAGPLFHFQLHDDGGNECRYEAPADGFGLVTNEPGSRCTPHRTEARTAFTAYQLAARYFPDTQVLWDDVQDGAVRRIAFYHPDSGERRTLVWATGGDDAIARVPATGSSARRIAPDGSELLLTPTDGEYQVPVSRATNQSQPNVDTYTIGGTPYLIIEADTQPPTASITGLAQISAPAFEVAWDVADEGSGVVSTAIWVQRGSGPWEAWLNDQPASGSSLFIGEVGERYRFSILTSDRAGNGLTSEVFETTVTDTPEMARLSGQLFDTAGEPAAWAEVTIGSYSTHANQRGEFELLVPAGPWDVSVEGMTVLRGHAFLHDSHFGLIVPPANDAMVNGAFESELDGWVQSGSSPVGIVQLGGSRDKVVQLATSFVAAPDEGGEDGRAGGSSTISQQVRIPEGAPSLALLFKVDSAETEAGHDRFEVLMTVEGQSARLLHAQENESDWGYHFFDLSAYAGEDVTLTFTVYHSSAERPTSAFLDFVALGESPNGGAPVQIHLPMIRR